MATPVYGVTSTHKKEAIEIWKENSYDDIDTKIDTLFPNPDYTNAQRKFFRSVAKNCKRNQSMIDRIIKKGKKLLGFLDFNAENGEL